MAFRVPEQFRVRHGRLATDESYGNNGAFIVTLRHKQRVKVIASDGGGWEHVSVSREDRLPTWDEMCQVKELFWNDPEDVVMQLHPRKSEYVNNAQALHLWRPIGQTIPTPPALWVGVPGMNQREAQQLKEAARVP